MFDRLPNWWRALGVVLFSLATVTWPSASGASPTPLFNLVHQDVTVSVDTPGVAHFSLTISHPATAKVTLAIYPHLFARGQIALLVNGRGVSGPPTAVTTLSSAQCSTSGRALSVRLTTDGQTVAAHCRQPVLPLSCHASSCDGVFPLRYQVQFNGHTSTTWSLLAVRFSPVAVPLHLVVLGSVGPSAWEFARSATATMRTLAKFSTLPLAIGVDYRPLLDAIIGDDAVAASWRRALRGLVASPQHQAISAPPGAIDFGGLAANGLSSEVTSQLQIATGLLQGLTGRGSKKIVWDQGTSSVADLNALHAVGIEHVVINENSLQPVPSTTLAWGQPEYPTGAPGVTELATDDQLSAIVNNATIAPELRSVLAIDTMAFLHFVAPGDAATRSVVVPLYLGTVGSAFVHDFLSGLRTSPFVSAVPLVSSFAPSLVGANGTAPNWSLALTSSPSWSVENAQSLRALVTQLHSFVAGVASTKEVALLTSAVAQAEVRGSADQRQGAIDASRALLNGQLSSFRVDNSTVTLTSQRTALPITIVSTAHYPMTVLVHLVSNALDFAKGATFPVTLNTPTTVVRVPLRHASGSEATLQVIITTPSGQVVLAHTAIPVRVTGTSVVGYLLSFVSLLILGIWWWRTNRRKTTARRAK